MISIIGGEKKRTKLSVPTHNVRPTSSIKREAIFSILENIAKKHSYEMYKKKCFIDLFAGTGSLGLEAISRGAEYCYFFEINEKVIKTLEKNCMKICSKKKFQIIQQNVKKLVFNEVKFPVSTIFIDPPYNLDPFYELLKILISSGLITNKTIIVIEKNNNTVLKLPSKIKIFDERTYGKTIISFLSI